MTRTRRYRWLAAGAAVLAVILFFALRSEPTPVEVGVVTSGPLRVTIEDEGETRVRERWVVSAPVSGRLVPVDRDVGDAVSAGDVLARVYPAPLDGRARIEAGRRLEAAQAAAEASDARVAQATAAWERARRDRDDAQALLAQGAVARQAAEDASTAERVAAAELQQAQGAAHAAAHDVQGASAALVGADGTGPDGARLVLAPASGRVLRVLEERERVVSAGAPIQEIGEPGELEVVVDVLTEDAARLRVGAPALVTVGAGADTLTGRVVRIEPSAFTKVSPLGVEEQRVNVVVGLDGSPPGVGDRFRVDVGLVAWSADDVSRVPVAALFRSGGEWAVFVVEDGRARLRPIVIAQRGERQARVTAGLADGERVVLYPGADVVDGARVEVEAEVAQ